MKAVLVLIQTLSQFGIPRWPNLDSDFEFDELSIQNVLSNFIAYEEYSFLDISRMRAFVEKPIVSKLITSIISIRR